MRIGGDGSGGGRADVHGQADHEHEQQSPRARADGTFEKVGRKDDCDESGQDESDRQPVREILEHPAKAVADGFDDATGDACEKTRSADSGSM